MKNEQDLIFEAYTKTIINEDLGNTPLEELSILSPEEYEMVQNFENFDADDWGYNKLQRFYFRKRKGGEDNEDLTDDNYDELFGGADEPSVFERLEEIMNSKPELEGVLKPILLEFEDAMKEIDNISKSDFDPQEVFTSLARLYPF